MDSLPLELQIEKTDQNSLCWQRPLGFSPPVPPASNKISLLASGVKKEDREAKTLTPE